jgi:hypothetical protein
MLILVRDATEKIEFINYYYSTNGSTFLKSKKNIILNSTFKKQIFIGFFLLFKK